MTPTWQSLETSCDYNIIIELLYLSLCIVLHCIVLIDGCLFVDVCCPFDNDAEALRDAEQRKLNKYEVIKQFFFGQGNM